MVNTVREFIIQMLERAENEYKENMGFIPRFKHRNKLTQVHLSDDLFDRIIKEEKISGRQNQVNIEGIDVLNIKHPEIGMCFVINLHGHYPVGYSPSHYGLRP